MTQQGGDNCVDTWVPEGSCCCSFPCQVRPRLQAGEASFRGIGGWILGSNPARATFWLCDLEQGTSSL